MGREMGLGTVNDQFPPRGLEVVRFICGTVVTGNTPVHDHWADGEIGNRSDEVEHGTRAGNGKGQRGKIINEAGTGRSIAAPGSHEIPYGRGIACIAALPIWRWLANARDMVSNSSVYSSTSQLHCTPQRPALRLSRFDLVPLHSEGFCGTVDGGCLTVNSQLAVYPIQTVPVHFPQLLVASRARNASQVVPVRCIKRDAAAWTDSKRGCGRRQQRKVHKA